MSRLHLLLLNGAILSVCAVFIDKSLDTLLLALLLCLPLLDKQCRNINLYIKSAQIKNWLAISAVTAILLLLNPEFLLPFVSILLLTSLPEEWFFRRYFQTALTSQIKAISAQPWKVNWLANIATSFLFALLHTPTQGLWGLAVFFPSLIFGWLYQLKQDLIFVILVHALFNLFFIHYIQKYISI